MKISVILGHPYKNSFNHAIAEVTLMIFGGIHDSSINSKAAQYPQVS
jgi:putative NADPH-quinone reductase